MENNYTKILPHLFAACSLIEEQVKKLDKVEESMLVSDILELDGIKDILKKLFQTANFLQMSSAKNQITESARYISIYYGLLYIVRPSITRLVGAYVNPNIKANVIPAEYQQVVIMH